MKAMRHLLEDKLLRGGFAALAAYLLVLQVFVGGFSAGAMAATAGNTSFVICAPSGDVPPGWTGSGKPAKQHEKNLCPCASLCGVGKEMAFAPDVDAGAIPLPRPSAELARPGWPDDTRLPPSSEQSWDAPRGPPNRIL
ncbi:hypothetical protein SAMN04488498_107128 [Mesorhizobium albiziae]|uniref:DUF2946 domain-containing protein n=1 Tax=Neomesorhizobium albiziae TaxID=335020 RepID=A0A1I4A4E5_9HYPH|nr:hypothetical protein [Mesorhizobium albiziae]GLS34021.1 hypothetical protein GCM10007937_57340 [Mesorhizobium albiziae]SFK50746.1 hypothetical protein SAMN04488498_107128 [Mesorhizobium albiziae]